MGVLGTVAHNLDAPGGAAFAQTQFERLLKANPDHGAGNYPYGTFLAGTGRPKEACKIGLPFPVVQSPNLRIRLQLLFSAMTSGLN